MRHALKTPVRAAINRREWEIIGAEWPADVGLGAVLILGVIAAGGQ
jgi:hypothetical protein